MNRWKRSSSTERNGHCHHYVYYSAGAVILYLICSCVVTKWRTCTYVENSFAKWLGKWIIRALERRWDNGLLRLGFRLYLLQRMRLSLVDSSSWTNAIKAKSSVKSWPPGLQLIVAEGRAIRLWQKELEQPLRRLGAGNVKIRQGNFAWLHAYPIPIHLTSIGSLLEMWKLTQLMEYVCFADWPPFGFLSRSATEW